MNTRLSIAADGSFTRRGENSSVCWTRKKGNTGDVVKRYNIYALSPQERSSIFFLLYWQPGKTGILCYTASRNGQGRVGARPAYSSNADDTGKGSRVGRRQLCSPLGNPREPTNSAQPAGLLYALVAQWQEPWCAGSSPVKGKHCSAGRSAGSFPQVQARRRKRDR